MKFGLVLSQFTDRWGHVESDARLADESGLDSVWLVDHLIGMASATGPVFEAWTGLSYVAAITERVRLGHLVNCVSYRNPGLLAKMATTVDHASGGRLDLGLGAGWYEPEYQAFGYEFPSAGKRRRFFEAYLEALLALFSGDTVDMDREGVRLDGATLSPTPIQEPHPPIVIGTAGSRMLAVTGRLADVWNCPAGTLPRLEEARAIVDEAAGGRSVRTSIQVAVAVGRNDAEAAEAMSLAEVQLAWMGDVATTGIVGTVPEAVRRVEEYRNRGVDEIVGIAPYARRRPDFIRAYAEVAERFAGA
jgi:alkanesulfonate monooxygenase SsuD/methylene tetrahydromethanopterin reductase-like flavin-dependent oxidoreductase (luciferase family)